MNLLGIDPGNTTGWALVTINEKIPKLTKFGECKDSTLLELEDYFIKADIIVMEDFLIDPTKAMTGSFNNSRMLTIQVIGAAQSLAKRHQKKLVLQSRTIKPVGYGYAKIPYVKKKSGVHVFDSIAHAMYYGVKNGLCVPIR